VNLLDSVTDYRRAGEVGDVTLMHAALHPDVALRSPLSDRARFVGRDAVEEVIGAALSVFGDLRYHTEIGDDRTRVLVSSGTVDGVAFDETTVLRLAEDGRITEVALSIRPLPALAAVMRAIGGALLAAQGHPGAGRAVRISLGPLVGLTRLADRLAGAVAG
jgi:SnoaL-like protein